MAASAPAEPGPAPDPAAPPPAAAPAQPADVPSGPESRATPAPDAQARGPIPFDRHESILRNARTKTETEVTQRFQERYGPHVALGERITADPVGTVIGLIEGLAQHPEHGQAVMSGIARALGSRRQQASETEEPQADLTTPDGTLVYSAPQQAKREAWFRQQLEGAIDQRLQPLQQERDERLAYARVEQAKADATSRMEKVIEPYRKLLPDFDKHKPVLWEKASGYLQDGHDAQTALGLAVLSVIQGQVLPARVAESQQQLLAQAVAKATGATTPPGTAPSAPAKRPLSFEEAFKGVGL
jgi:hypothetical protein